MRKSRTRKVNPLLLYNPWAFEVCLCLTRTARQENEADSIVSLEHVKQNWVSTPVYEGSREYKSMAAIDCIEAVHEIANKWLRACRRKVQKVFRVSWNYLNS